MQLKVEGLDKLDRDLRLIRDRSAATKTERFVLDGAQEIADAVRPLAPVGTTSKNPGTLRKAIRAFKAKRRGRYIAGAISWVDRKAAPHLHLVAFGTKPHIIRPKTRKAVRERGPGQEFLWRKVSHPGAKPNDFFSETVQRVGPRVLEKVTKRIADFMMQPTA